MTPIHDGYLDFCFVADGGEQTEIERLRDTIGESIVKNVFVSTDGRSTYFKLSDQVAQANSANAFAFRTPGGSDNVKCETHNKYTVKSSEGLEDPTSKNALQVCQITHNLHASLRGHKTENINRSIRISHLPVGTRIYREFLSRASSTGGTKEFAPILQHEEKLYLYGSFISALMPSVCR